jgi:protoporphyrinogen oxidase
MADGLPVLLLGAGPAGMTGAMELYNQGVSFQAVEKNSQAGGLARTLEFGEFKTDIGPHRFFSKNKYLYDFIEELLGEEWILVDRFTQFFSDGKFLQYPHDLKEILLNFGLLNLFVAGWDFAFEKTRSKLFPKEIKSFEDFAVSAFGKKIAEVNILEYTEKVWGIPCSQISKDWAQQRIRGLSVRSIVEKSFLKKKGPKTLVDQFYYPENGTGTIYERIKEKVEEKSEFFFESFPVEVNHKNNRIEKVVVRTKNGLREFKPKNVLTSIPISGFVELLNPKPPLKVLKAVRKLRFRSQVYLFLTINKKKISPNQWIYFPQKEIPFGRISEMKNFSSKMSPSNKTSLFIEFFCWENDKVWNMSKEELLGKTMIWLEKLKLLKKEEIIDSFIHKQQFVYPVYDLEYEKNLEIVKKYLNQFENLEYMGRPGRFKYTNQDHSLEMGILAAQNIIKGKKTDLDSVGSEKEYFEKRKI